MKSNHRERQIVEASPGYEPHVGRAVWMLEDTRRRTKRSLDGLTQPVIDWREARTPNSIGALLYHVAAIEIDWLFTDVLEGRAWPPEAEALFPFDVRDATGALVDLRGVSLDEHLHRLDAVRALLLEAFRGMSLDEFRRERHMAGYDVTPEWVLHHLMQHEAEHRGQIGELRARAEQAIHE